MRLSALAPAAVLHFAICTSAFCPNLIGARTLSQRARSFPAVQANAFDDWWEERKTRNTLRNREQKVQAPSSAPEPLQLDRDSVALVLTEFVRSDYALQLCNRANVDGTDYGQISGMFESVRLVNTKIVVKLKQAFGERTESLLDRLAKYFRMRIPHVVEIHAEHREGVDIY